MSASFSIRESVFEFHQKYMIPNGPIPCLPAMFSPERRLREKLLVEEVDELLCAEEMNDIIEIADALADIVYVCYGTAAVYGINLDRVLVEVHRSNMTKTRDPDGGKVLKGPNYEAPNIALSLGLI